MANLISKNEDMTRSAPYIGFEILKLLNENDQSRISIFDLAKKLKNKNDTTARSIYYGMLFLYSLGIVDFDEPYVVKNA